MIPQGFVQELLNRVDIVDVVERHLPLKRAGANYVACCPFHGEKTPSFTVSPGKQFYHCFGCGAHGTAIGFLMEHLGMSFPEAVKELAGRAGMTVPEDRAVGAAPRSAGLHEVLLQAARFYRDQLKRSDRAVAYLRGRGLTGDVAARFGLGYAPPGWQGLAGAFPDYQAKALVDAGLVIQGEDGKRYDRFRDRVMFPILNQRGQVIGFGGRVLDQGEPKYLNSPETPVFEKGRELYGLYQARGAIRRQGMVLVVEGYMDVVALSQMGVENAVATLGTATTAHQVSLLLRQTDSVVFCFDGDEAGRRAAWRALENSLGQLSDGKSLSFLFLPEAEDPDSYVRKAGREGFERLLRSALPLSSFLVSDLSERVDLATQEGRAKLLEMARPLVQRISAPALGLLVRKRVAEVAGLTLGELNSLFQIKEVSPSTAPVRRPPKGQSLYRKLVQCIFIQPELARRPGLDRLHGGGEEGELLRQMVEFVTGSPHMVSTAALIQHFASSPLDAKLTELEREVAPLGLGDFDAETEFAGALTRIGQICADEARRRELEALHAKTPEDWTPEERARYRALLERPAPSGGSN
jgi:DNA primase